MCRLLPAQKANCFFLHERIRNASENDLEYQSLKSQVRKDFPVNKHELPELVHPYWNAHYNLLFFDDDFLLKVTRLVILASLHKFVLADLHAFRRGIEGTKARARLIVYWPGIEMASPIHVRAARSVSLIG